MARSFIRGALSEPAHNTPKLSFQGVLILTVQDLNNFRRPVIKFFSQHSHVMTDFGVGNSSVDLGSFDTRVAEDFAYRLDRHTIGKRDGRRKCMTKAMEKHLKNVQKQNDTEER